MSNNPLSKTESNQLDKQEKMKLFVCVDVYTYTWIHASIHT